MKTSNILLSVALIAVAGLGISPVRKTTLEREVQNKQLFEQKQVLKERYEAIEQIQNELKIGGIPSSPEQIALINDVNDIAKKAGFSLPESWKFSIGSNSDVNAEQISIGFSLSGRRAQLLKFLQEVEQNPRFMGVKDFAFTTDTSGAVPQTKMDITLYAFFIEA